MHSPHPLLQSPALSTHASRKPLANQQPPAQTSHMLHINCLHSEKYINPICVWGDQESVSNPL